LAAAAALDMSDDIPSKRSLWVRDINRARKQLGETDAANIPSTLLLSRIDHGNFFNDNRKSLGLSVTASIGFSSATALTVLIS